MILKKEYILEKPLELNLYQEEFDLLLFKDFYYCESIFTAISSGTEVAAFYGERPLKNTSVYPRKLGYLNISKIISIPNSGSSFGVGDLILTNFSHSDRFVCSKDEILTRLPDSENIQQFSFSYIYHMAYCAISSLSKFQEVDRTVAIIGNGLIGQAISEICLNLKIPCLVVSEYQSNLLATVSSNDLRVLNRADIKKVMSPNFPIVVVCTNEWNDYQIALNLVQQKGHIVLLGFPGRDGNLPLFNPFEPFLFYAKNISVSSLSTSRPDNSNSKIDWLSASESCEKIVGEIESGNLGKITKLIPIISSKFLRDAYINLKTNPERPLSFILQW